MIGRWLNLARARLRPPPPVVTETPPVAPAPPAEPSPAAPTPAGAPFSRPGAPRSPFTPTRPVRSETALFGRRRQLDRAIAAIELEHAHLAIFGERGHGKTSLANVIAAQAEAGGYGVVRHACSAGMRFSDLIGEIVEKIPPRFLRRVASDAAEAPAPSLPAWTVAEATAVLERIRAGHVLVFIDEFDRLTDADAKRDMTELLKNIADLGLRVSFVLIGVAESLEGLLALHRSIHRSLVAIPVPLLTDADLTELIEQGCTALGLRVEPAALAALLELAHHAPYYAQLLALHATDATQRRAARAVTPDDVAAAASLVLQETAQTFEPLLARLSEADCELLYAAARTPCDGFGWFPASALGADPALARLADPASGPILRLRQSGGLTEIGFAQPNLRNHLLLRGAGR